ncbi:transcriptional regulator [Roseateles cavernae]|uniref:transcriptional regulator n=1 Tax=Roseateles cavernae TaxID=3153578 RepID=UPI0032E4B185
MQLADYFKAKRGRLSRVALAVGVQSGYLSQVAAGTKKVMPRYVPAIERATDFAVRCWELCPDDWHMIWPAVIGTEGAPPIPQAEEEARHAA